MLGNMYRDGTGVKRIMHGHLDTTGKQHIVDLHLPSIIWRGCIWRSGLKTGLCQGCILVQKIGGKGIYACPGTNGKYVLLWRRGGKGL